MIHPISEAAKIHVDLTDKVRDYAKWFGFHFEKYGDDNEWGWFHPAWAEDEELYLSELDCIWAALQKLADSLVSEGFVGVIP